MFQSFSEEIEKNYPVETIKANGVEVWTYLRMSVHMQLEARAFDDEMQSLVKVSKKNKLSYLLHSLGALFEPIPNRPVMCFTDQNLRVDDKGKAYDILFDPLMDTLGQDNCLCVESRTFLSSVHTQKNQAYSQNFVTQQALLIRALPHIPIRINWEGKDCLEAILKTYNISLDPTAQIRKYLMWYNFYKKWLKKMSPKALFLTCYFGKPALVKAARELDIPVIEIQHGLIDRTLFWYVSSKPLYEKAYPSHMFSFGRWEKELLAQKPCFIAPENVHAVGSDFLEKKKQAGQQETLKQPENTDLFTISVSGNYMVQEPVLQFLEAVLDQDPSLHIYYYPRFRSGSKSNALYTPNARLTIVDKGSIYDGIMQTDCHATTWSTCGIEAPFFDKPVIFINLNNCADIAFDDAYLSQPYIKIADSPESFVQAVNVVKKTHFSGIAEQHESYMGSTYQASCKSALNHLGLLT